jgi:hypothetical protein
MTNTLVVGDVHGIVEVVEAALTHDGPIVFLGDLVDSFNRTITDQLRCVELVLRAVEEKKASLILGNHEVSYLKGPQRCAGFSELLQMQLESKGYLKEIERIGKSHLWLGKPRPFQGEDQSPLLLSHAGFSPSLPITKKFSSNFRNLDFAPRIFDLFDKDVSEAFCDERSWFYWAGKLRGGRAPVGGPLWLDTAEFAPVEGIRQIFGHTPQRMPKVFPDGSLCINVQDGNFAGALVNEAGEAVDFKWVHS